MPRKYDDFEKFKWLDQNEAGRSIAWIANQHKIDRRTIKDGIADAQRMRDAKSARIDLIREALKKHQAVLLNSLANLKNAIQIPPDDLAVLSWLGKNKSVLAGPEETKKLIEKEAKVLSLDPDKMKMLKQHITKKTIWRTLSDWEKAYALHIMARHDFQHEVIFSLRKNTGLAVLSEFVSPPLVYSYTTGHLFYTSALNSVLGGQKDVDFKKRMHFDQENNRITFDNATTLIELKSGVGEKSLEGLTMAYKEIKASPELKRVKETHDTFKKPSSSLNDAIERYVQMGFISGSCHICRNLGIV